MNGQWDLCKEQSAGKWALKYYRQTDRQTRVDSQTAAATSLTQMSQSTETAENSYMAERVPYKTGASRQKTASSKVLALLSDKARNMKTAPGITNG